MLKFNNQHIFTGYIKQLLASFNLPKYYKNTWIATTLPNYYYNKKIPNYTKNLEIKSNIYDSYTHEYLGEYLRFQKYYNNIDLLSLYNCFSNNICELLNVSIQINNGTNSSTVTFNTTDSGYKIYMLPVKFNRAYTIAIEASAGAEVFCGFYNNYYYDKLDEDKVFKNKIAENTYKKYNNLTFNSPELFITPDLEQLDDESIIEDKDFYYAHEDDLKLFLKLPINNNSSITILEGNYIGYNDNHKGKNNQFIINFENVDDVIKIFKPISRLQLLTLNTGQYYPFADRLLEYLTDMAITNTDLIDDNIVRTQTVMHAAGTNFEVVGAWDDKIRAVAYTNMFNGSFGSSKGTTLNTFNINYDILGYIDKTVEKYFKAEIDDKVISLENVDIYKNIYKDSK